MVIFNSYVKLPEGMRYFSPLSNMLFFHQHPSLISMFTPTFLSYHVFCLILNIYIYIVGTIVGTIMVGIL